MSQRRHVQSILHALDALELIGSAPRGLSLFEISCGLQVSKPSAYYIAETLAHKGYLQKLDRPVRYRLGPVMRELGSRQARWNRDVLARSTLVAVRLARRLDALVRVCQYVANEVISRLYVPGEQGEPPLNLYARLVATYGSALFYQAFMTESQLRDYRDKHPFGNAADLTYWKSLRLVDKTLARARPEGYLAFVKSGIFRAAAAVFGAMGTISAVITVVKDFDRMCPGEARECIELLRLGANEVTASLRNGVGAKALASAAEG